MLEKELKELISAGIENDQIDFKEQFYHKEKNYDLIKDVVSFANNTKYINKYIVFGVENNSKRICGIRKGSMPDISKINDLLHTYVEPFIDIEIGEIDFQGNVVGFICISCLSLDRPYLITKDFEKNGTIFLRKGAIYVRKGATNFVADRHDLDEIYDNKGVLEINFYKPAEICFSIIRIGNQDLLMGQVRCVLNNTSDSSFVVDKLIISVNSGNSLIDYSALFLDDHKKYFEKQPQDLSLLPKNIKTGERLQKTIYFKASEQSVLNVYHIICDGGNVAAQIMIHDVTDKDFQSELSSIKINFSQELIKRWEKRE